MGRDRDRPGRRRRLHIAILMAARAPAWGAGTVGLFAPLTALTALSILWSVQPDDSWQAGQPDAGLPGRLRCRDRRGADGPRPWRSVVAGIALVWSRSAATGCSPRCSRGRWPPARPQGRLEIPFGYWNATGAAAVHRPGPVPVGMAAAPGCRWLRGLAVPARGRLLTRHRSVLLADPRWWRSSMAGGWLVLVPWRLRSVALLALSGAGPP